ncbi:cupin domain-containing protein [Streptomyces maoxianensis]|uniref:Cupin domain-containing protein n=1 Tax=Streptomyces maoxianensis TaxID=1459942 RepID=A0ABV9G5L6_9ACTN|nr:cupin domain-containing protein [Streptomyces sp. ISL-1]MBT2390959.1 cupin domain-containing protein [Streptomyces sp. ISL-1]
MSYPDPKYVEGRGEITAEFRPADTPADLRSGTGSRTHYLATDASTRGEFGLYRMDMAPKAGGPRTHFHKSISESFFIIEGTVRLYNGESWIDGTAGDFLYVPQGGLHAFRNDSDDPASMLLLFTPGAPREEYFEKVAEVATEWSPEEQAEFFIKHDTYWTE